MKKILHLSKPYLTTYPKQTNVLSVVSVDDKYLEWLYSNFIQIYIVEYERGKLQIRILPDYPPNSSLSKHYSYCPFITYYRLPRWMVTKEHSLKEWIVSAIDDDLCVLITLDSYFISQYSYYFKNIHREHEVLIYGYDLSNDTLYAADFFRDEYEYKEISMQEVERAFTGINNPSCLNTEGGLLVDYLNGIELMKYDRNADYTFDLENVIVLLKDYLHSKNDANKLVFHSEDCVFGISIYDEIATYIRNQSYISLLIRGLQIFYIHKKLMFDRIQYISQRYSIQLDSLQDSYREIMKAIHICRNIAMKSQITGNSLSPSLLTIIEDTKQKEETTLQSLLHILEELRNTNSPPQPL